MGTDVVCVKMTMSKRNGLKGYQEKWAPNKDISIHFKELEDFNNNKIVTGDISTRAGVMEMATVANFFES